MLKIGKHAMNYKIINMIRANENVHRFARYCYRPLCSSKLPFYLFLDPVSIMNKWYKEVKSTQLNRNLPLFIDRINEITQFFDINKTELFKYFISNGLPGSDKFKEHYLRSFIGNVSEEKLKSAYDNISFEYTCRLMLAYERYSFVTGYLDFIISHSGLKPKQFTVLDYGCGAADIALLFNVLGANVTICDLDNIRFEFVIQRFMNRDLQPDAIRISNTEIYPDLPSAKFDLIVATEIFEHVRDPLALLKNFSKAIKPGGYLLDSMAGEFDRDDRPHHLKEAFLIGQSSDFKTYYHKNFRHLNAGSGLRYLFQKRTGS